MELSIFETTARRAENLASSHFNLYKTKLILFALAGYLVIFSLLTLAIGSLVGIGYLAIFYTGWIILLVKKKVIFLIIPMIWMLLKACWVRIEAPEGFELKAKDYPELFEQIEQLRKVLKAPKIHRVILTQEMNAAIAQTPRLGIFGWQKNTLVLGVELLLVLSTNQTRAVIAHEFGHLSGNHSRFNGWIYRVRSSWFQIMQAFDQQSSWGGTLMAKFFDFYAPRFAAYSFVLTRANEFEADKVAAAITSPEVMGKALVNSYVVSTYIEEKYWQDFFKLADQHAEPPYLPWSGLRKFFNDNDVCEKYLKKALASELTVETRLDNTHPALSDRLKAIGCAPQLPQPVSKSAAQELLGENYSEVIGSLDKDWLNQTRDRWNERYQYIQSAKIQLTEYQEKSLGELPADEHWHYCCLVGEVISHEQGIELTRDYQQKYPESSQAAYVIGSHLFEQGNDECLQQFDIAINEPSLVIDSCEMAYQFLSARNCVKEAEEWRKIAEQQLVKDEEADLERQQLTLEDSLKMASINEAVKNQIRVELMNNESIKSAWLAEKEVVYYKETPMLVIAVKPRGFFFSQETALEQVYTMMEIDASYIIVPNAGDYKSLYKKIIQSGEALF